MNRTMVLAEPNRPMGERRIKRSPLRDVAAMVRSFDYITYGALFKLHDLGALQPEQFQQLEPWSRFWYRWVSAAYLRAYIAALGPSDLLPQNKDDLALLFDAHLLEKAIYEVGYELTHRPNWLLIPLRGLLHLLEPGIAVQ